MMIVLVDYSWLYYRSKFAYQNLHVLKKGVKYNTGVIFGVYQSLSIIFQHNPKADIYLCLDGIPTKQLALDQTYKADREHENIQDSIDIGYVTLAQHMTLIPRVKIAYHPEMEADETIAFLAETLDRNKDEITVIFSTDSDLRQLVNSEKNIFASKTESTEIGFELEDEEFVFRRGPKETQGVDPTGIALYKAIVGDSSDNIKGIERFHKATAKLLSNEFKTVDALGKFIHNDESYKSSRHRQALFRVNQEWAKVVRNYNITNIDPDHVPEIVESHPEANKDFFEYYEAVKCLSGIERLIAEQS